MTWFLGSMLFPVVLAVIVSLLFTKSGAFKEGAGIVLGALVVIAVVVAAIAGALTGILPAALAFWTGRIALFCLVFAIGCWFFDR